MRKKEKNDLFRIVSFRVVFESFLLFFSSCQKMINLKIIDK